MMMHIDCTTDEVADSGVTEDEGSLPLGPKSKRMKLASFDTLFR